MPQNLVEANMKTLFILNDGPYGTERSYNALRLALGMKKRDHDSEVTVFLLSEAVQCAHANQKTPDGYFNMERMLKGVIAGKGRVLICGTCIDARGISEESLVTGAVRSTMAELADATAEADKVLVY